MNMYRRYFFKLMAGLGLTGVAITALPTPAGARWSQLLGRTKRTPHCALCGYTGGTKAWIGAPYTLRCCDAKGCQDRQINTLHGTKTIWQAKQEGK